MILSNNKLEQKRVKWNIFCFVCVCTSVCVAWAAGKVEQVELNVLYLNVYVLSVCG